MASKNGKKSKTKLTKFLNGLWFAAIAGSLGMVIEAACQLYLPKIMGRIIDKGVTPVIEGTAADDYCGACCNRRRHYLYEAVV